MNVPVVVVFDLAHFDFTEPHMLNVPQILLPECYYTLKISQAVVIRLVASGISDLDMNPEFPKYQAGER
jgi:hypothetical protein